MTEYAPPGFSGYYRDLKFGINAGIFYDFGAVWYQTENLTKKHFHNGFGAGLHFRMPYIEVFRVELGFDNNLHPQFIADLEVAF